MLLLPPARVDGLVSVVIELLSAFTDWHTGLVSAVVPELVLGVVADTVGDGGDVFEVDFELEPQPANAKAASASVAVAIQIERRDMSIASSFMAGTSHRLITRDAVRRRGSVARGSRPPRQPSIVDRVANGLYTVSV